MLSPRFEPRLPSSSIPFVSGLRPAFAKASRPPTKGDKMKTFRTLELAISFHEQALELKVQGHLKDQLVRAAASIPLNLAEGNAKSSVKEKKRFYQTAYASLKEVQTILRMSKIEDPNLLKTADHLGACLYKLLFSKITEIVRPPA